MSAQYKFNGSVAKLQHEMWKNKLITFLNGGPAPTTTSHRECALGKWIYEEGGLEEYKALPEMQRLEKVHADFHDSIKNAIELQNAGELKVAWELYEALKPMSNELLTLIDAISNAKLNVTSR